MGIVDWEPRALPDAARCDRWAGQGGAWFGEDRVYQQQFREGVGRFMLAVGGQRLSDVGPDPTAAEWRPMTKKRDPAPWSEFYAATHPPIPEGWEAVGEWFLWGKGSRHPEYDATLTDEGEMIGKSERATKIPMYGCHVRRILPAIPEGWEARSEWVTRGTHVPAAAGPEDCVLLEDGRVVPWIPNDYAGTFRAVRKVPPPADWGDVPKGVELRPDCGFGGARNEVVINGAHVGRVFDKTDGVYHTHTTNHEPVAGSPFATLPAAIVALTGRRE